MTETNQMGDLRTLPSTKWEIRCTGLWDDGQGLYDANFSLYKGDEKVYDWGYTGESEARMCESGEYSSLEECLAEIPDRFHEPVMRALQEL